MRGVLRVVGGAVLLFSLLAKAALGRALAQGRNAADTVWNQTDAQGRKHGFWKKNHPNSHRRYIAQFEHGVQVGKSIRYSPSGTVLSRLEFLPDGHTAHAVIYGNRNRVQAKGDFYDQVKDGKWVYYNGRRVIGEENWKRGVKHGLFVVYTDTGTPASKENWKNGRQEGVQQIFYGNGRVRMEWNMRNGFEEGQSYTFYPDGYVRLEGKFAKGKRVGQWIYRNDQGRKEEVLVYEDGKLVSGRPDRQADSVMRAWEKNKGRIKEPDLNDVRFDNAR